MLNGVPLLFCCAVQVHIVPPVLHNEPLKFLDTLKLQQDEPTVRQAISRNQQRNNVGVSLLSISYRLDRSIREW
jgi:hypothetical protein